MKPYLRLFQQRSWHQSFKRVAVETEYSSRTNLLFSLSRLLTPARLINGPVLGSLRKPKQVLVNIRTLLTGVRSRLPAPPIVRPAEATNFVAIVSGSGMFCCLGSRASLCAANAPSAYRVFKRGVLSRSRRRRDGSRPRTANNSGFQVKGLANIADAGCSHPPLVKNCFLFTL